MGFKKTAIERLQDRNNSIQQQFQRANQQAQRVAAQKVAVKANGSVETKPAPVAIPTAAAEVLTTPSAVKFIEPALATLDGTTPLYVTPWAARLATLLLQRSLDRKVSLRLVWPAEIDTAVTLHAVASLSKVLHTELSGLRTLFYPGTDTTWVALDGITTDRHQYDQLCRDFYNGRVPVAPSQSFQGALEVCRKAEYATAPPPLRIRQLIPAFRYERNSNSWGTVKTAPIDALISKIPKSLRSTLRAGLGQDWDSALSAPGALLVLHRELRRKEIKAALVRTNPRALVGADAILVDASMKVIQADPRAIRYIPRMLKAAFDALGHPVGTLIMTNDPTEYFILGNALEKEGIAIDREVLAAESTGTDWLASTTRRPAEWKPDLRSMINFKVRAIDEQAAAVARQVRRIVDAVHEEGAWVEDPLLLAQGIVLRTSLLPGGLVDLESDDPNARSWLARQFDFGHMEGMIRAMLATGGAQGQRQQIERVIQAIYTHLAACQNATPLAMILYEQVKKHVLDEKEDMTIVFFKSSDILVAQAYLARNLGEQWETAKSRIQWFSLREALANLHSRTEDRHLIIVGLNPSTLRFLVTQKEIPAHATLLIPSHQAVRALPQLRHLNKVEVLKPYRPRLADLQKCLEDCLKNVPDVEALARAYDTRLPVSARQAHSGEPQDLSAYRLYLEDGRCVSTSGTVFRYDGLEDERFRRTSAKDIEVGDSIFEMSDGLREEMEVVLSSQGLQIAPGSTKGPLDYCRDVMRRALDATLPGMNTSERVAALRKKMGDLNSGCQNVSDSKLKYWIGLRNEDSAPHQARDQSEFRTYCQALSIPEAMTDALWPLIKTVRVANQKSGRRMSAVYTEMLLAPESANLYRGISPETTQMLQSKALDCVSKVIRKEPPETVRQGK